MRIVGTWCESPHGGARPQVPARGAAVRPAGRLAARGGNRHCTESGEAPGWQGAGRQVSEEQRSQPGWIVARMQPMFRHGLLVSVLLLGLCMAGPAAAQSSPAIGPAAWLPEAERHFAAGNELAGAGREAEQEFRAALLRYEGAVEALGRSNGFLLYNIGNTYLRLGDVGRAILHYREAQRFIPADPNLRQSLRHARSLRRDRIGTDAAGSVLLLVFFWHHTWPLQLRMGLFLAAANLLWLLALLRALGAVLGTVAALPKSLARLGEWLAGTGSRRHVRRSVTTALVAAAGVIAGAAGGSVAVELLAPVPETAVILAPEITARRGDSDAYEPSFTTPLHAGTELLVLEERNDWLHVALADGRRAWLPAHAVAVVGR